MPNPPDVVLANHRTYRPAFAPESSYSSEGCLTASRFQTTVFDSMPGAHQPWLTREILLAFWKAHILHHAAHEPIIGQRIMRELRGHGYDVSGGTLYPLLARMEERGWLRSRRDPRGGLRARREYTLTTAGRTVLGVVRRQIEELHREVVLGKERR